jgi:predicted RNA binding protein YcfA (HicA-like mRNA interferase family)
MNGFYSQVIALIRAAGYSKIPNRGKGSHEVWTNGTRNQIIPFNMASRHTANGILKSCGIDEKL